jgi:branched-chain amino acid transport system ATP-binding protein
VTLGLQVEQLEVSYGAVRALRGVSLDVSPGDLHVVLGPNGAGKSSIVRSIAGVVRPRHGAIRLVGDGISSELTRLPPHRINRLGVAWIPEGREIFANLTVEENLRMGAYRERRSEVIARRLEESFARFPILSERRRQLAGSLSGGEQQMLAISRALMSEPRLVLLDEPSLGLAPKIVKQLFDFVRRICDDGVTILMAEQNARQALRVADFAYLLENGEIRRSGTSDEMRQHDDVRAAYLGG